MKHDSPTSRFYPYIENFRATHDPSRKINFNVGGNWGSYGGQESWNSTGGSGKLEQNPDG